MLILCAFICVVTFDFPSSHVTQEYVVLFQTQLVSPNEATCLTIKTLMNSPTCSHPMELISKLTLILWWFIVVQEPVREFFRNYAAAAYFNSSLSQQYEMNEKDEKLLRDPAKSSMTRDNRVHEWPLICYEYAPWFEFPFNLQDIDFEIYLELSSSRVLMDTPNLIRETNISCS